MKRHLIKLFTMDTLRSLIIAAVVMLLPLTVTAQTTSVVKGIQPFHTSTVSSDGIDFFAITMNGGIKIKQNPNESVAFGIVRVTNEDRSDCLIIEMQGRDEEILKLYDEVIEGKLDSTNVTIKIVLSNGQTLIAKNVSLHCSNGDFSDIFNGHVLFMTDFDKYFDRNNIGVPINSKGLLSQYDIVSITCNQHTVPFKLFKTSATINAMLNDLNKHKGKSTPHPNNDLVTSTPFLTVDGKTDVTSNYSYSGGTYNYLVKTNSSDYSVTMLPSWCSVSKYADVFTITCDRNNSSSSRSDWFKVSAGDLSVKVHVSQPSDPNAISGEIENVWVDYNAVQQYGLLFTKGMNIHIKFSTHNLLNEKCSACAFFYAQDGTPLSDYNYQYRTSDGYVYAETSFRPNYVDCSYSDLVIFMPYVELHMSIGAFNLKFNLQLMEYSSGSWKTFARKNDNNFQFYNAGY